MTPWPTTRAPRGPASSASSLASDITDNVIRELALPLGVVDVKVAAIDADWSGLRLVWRLARRADAARGGAAE